MSEFFRELLLKQLDDLLDRAVQTVGLLVKPSDSEADPLDQAATDSNRNYTLRIRDRESHLIKKNKDRTGQDRGRHFRYLRKLRRGNRTGTPCRPAGDGLLHPL